MTLFYGTIFLDMKLFVSILLSPQFINKQGVRGHVIKLNTFTKYSFIKGHIHIVYTRTESCIDLVLMYCFCLAVGTVLYQMHLGDGLQYYMITENVFHWFWITLCGYCVPGLPLLSESILVLGLQVQPIKHMTLFKVRYWNVSLIEMEMLKQTMERYLYIQSNVNMSLSAHLVEECRL